MIQIDLPLPPPSAKFTQQTTIDGQVYTFEFMWNARMQKWLMTLSDQDGVAIRSGITMVRDFPLIRRVVDERRPPGDFMLLKDTAPTLDDIGSLFYFTAAEIAANG